MRKIGWIITLLVNQKRISVILSRFRWRKDSVLVHTIKILVPWKYVFIRKIFLLIVPPLAYGPLVFSYKVAIYIDLIELQDHWIRS